MNKTRLFSIIIFIGLIILGVIYSKKKYYDPAHRLLIAERQVKQLIDSDGIKNGDIIFQTSLSRQSKAIQLATHSKYSHCGLIFHLDTGLIKWYVLEAAQKVKWTPLAKWITRGEDGHYVIKRVYTDPPFPDPMLEELKDTAEIFIGKDYDIYFEWSNDKIYCSELVWKIFYQVTGLKIGELQKLHDFDLSSEIVKQKMKERYGDKIPLDEKVISPESIFNSSYLVTICDDKTPANNSTLPPVGL